MKMSDLGKEIMPEVTADWARMRSKVVISDKVKTQLKQALESVKKAIGRDDNSASCGIYAHEKTLEILRQRGFKVTVHPSVSQRESSYITITW